nr:hypothetical protein [Crucivirus sp.]
MMPHSKPQRRRPRWWTVQMRPNNKMIACYYLSRILLNLMAPKLMSPHSAKSAKISFPRWIKILIQKTPKTLWPQIKSRLMMTILNMRRKCMLFQSRQDNG